MNFVRRGQPFGGASWGASGTGTSTAYSLHHPFGQTAGAPISPPESEDGDFAHQRARAQTMMAKHPATEAAASRKADGETDTTVEDDNVDVGKEGAQIGTESRV